MNIPFKLTKIKFLISKNKYRLRFISRIFYIIHKFLCKIYFSYIPSYEKQISTNRLNDIKPFPKKVLNKFYKQKTDEIIFRNYLNHEFDLLGSGWCDCNKYIKQKKISKFKLFTKKKQENFNSHNINNLNYANKSKCSEVAKYISKSYKNIDWHIDIKSGFRWSEKQWYTGIKYGNKIGSDIKYPWELARLQHLPQLTIYLNTLDKRSNKAKNIEKEIYNQILDFIAFNPPLYGVNWSCTMEVAIRAVNILMAISLMSNKEMFIWRKHNNIIINSLYDHAKYILNNLEWSKNRGNHYLTNICGILCLSSLLPETFQTNRWLSFAIAELNREIHHQFNSDGSNFEGSTAYHNLSLEMILFSVIISLNNKESRLIKISKLRPVSYNFLPFYAKTPLKNKLYKNVIFQDKKIYSLYPNSTLQLLVKACTFLEDCSDQQGMHPQVGDNDSGRFLNLRPNWKKIKNKDAKVKFKSPKNFKNSNYLFQQPLLIKNVIELAKSVGIVNSKKIKNSFYYEFGKYIAENKTFDILKPKNFYFINPYGEERNLDLLKKEIIKNNKNNFLKKEIKLPQNISDFKISYRYYPDFGIHLWKNSFIFISIRSIQKKNPFIKSHFHEDQLSITLKLNDKHIFKDFGSYIYTPFPKLRNSYRSRKIHFPTSYEPDTDKALFENLEITSVNCSYSGIKGFSGIYISEYSIDKLVMYFTNKKVLILMGSESKSNKEKFLSKDDARHKLYYSPSYGMLEN
ncbi:hypothetical protein HA145_06915 [Prochlorococcus marinus XMU1411]|uniref:heparinase II/III family protein n=1 Tax=Prochlorococcus marinus TaxID=1219 RepID=UPI001AD95781|nr:heparinase II/III family protein [Prochlorococcus marinus]MBO8244206.1 hypothetical protein [Prochlorococcus marinus XMU1411]MBW3055291.1 hypothetical protein [Prochlorococcus marinus str. MU1411]MCR8537034.1 hypothetical protein [Prochlorococcus marinus CUG1430]